MLVEKRCINGARTTMENASVNAMNDKILRGFCEKCGMAMLMTHQGYAIHEWTIDTPKCGAGLFVPVLSSKQMKIIDDTITYGDWVKYAEPNDDGEMWFSLPKLLQENPSLVAKILSESETK